MDKKPVQLLKRLLIHSARLKFEKETCGKAISSVLVTIYNSNNGIIRKKDFKIPENKKNPDYINPDDLTWKRQTNKDVSKYSRTNYNGKHTYTDSEGIRVPLFLCNKLEDLVKEACFGNSNKTKHTK